MKQLIYICISLLIFTSQSFAQTLKSKDVYKLYRKGYTYTSDSIINKDSTNLNPFKPQPNQNQVTIYIGGLEQKYRFDIKITNRDTIAYFTSYTYQIKTIKPKKEEKRMFPNKKIKEKEEWKLITKVTQINGSIIDSILSIVNKVNFDSLPSFEIMMAETGLVQFDGHGFGFEIYRNNHVISYSVNSLYLNKHEKLIELMPIEKLLLDYISANEKLKVEYSNNACYNSGSIIWICN